MEIVGNGFLARNLRSTGSSHPGVVVLAAGVSTTKNMERHAYERETALVAETIRRCRSKRQLLVFFSTASAGIYGAPGCRGHEDDPVFPVSPFGRHKLALEGTVRDSGVRHLILRLGHAVGAQQREHALVPTLVKQLRSGHVVVHRGARRDVIDVRDAVTIIDDLLSAGVEAQVVNVGSGEAVPVELIIDRLETGLGTTAERSYVDGASSSCPLSLEKLWWLVPSIAKIGFGPDYYRTVIDRYVEGTVST